MIPIEWVARRIATGSFLKRNPGVNEGTYFKMPKIETFFKVIKYFYIKNIFTFGLKFDNIFKDDANDDPQWSDEQIIAAKLSYNQKKLIIERRHIALMKRWTKVIFRILEKAWKKFGSCVLVDMKIEFGVNKNG